MEVEILNNGNENVRQTPGPVAASVNHLGPGILYIFNHQSYNEHLLLEDRLGTEKDVKSLQDTFHLYGVQNHTFNNLKLHEIEDKVQELSETDFTSNSCIIIAFLTHGSSKYMIAAQDQMYSYYDLFLHIFVNPTLKSKAKILLFQTCRGVLDVVQMQQNLLRARQHNNNNLVHDGYSNNVLQTLQHGDFNEFYQLHSTTEAFVAYRSKVAGSIFIQTFCKHLEEFGRTKTIEILFDSVMEEVKTITKNHQLPELRKNATVPYVFGTYWRQDQNLNSNLFSNNYSIISESCSPHTNVKGDMEIENHSIKYYFEKEIGIASTSGGVKPKLAIPSTSGVKPKLKYVDPLGVNKNNPKIDEEEIQSISSTHDRTSENNSSIVHESESENNSIIHDSSDEEEESNSISDESHEETNICTNGNHSSKVSNISKSDSDERVSKSKSSFSKVMQFCFPCNNSKKLKSKPVQEPEVSINIEATQMKLRNDQLMKKQIHKWISITEQEKIKNPVIGGKDIDGDIIYIGRTLFKNEVLPCKVFLNVKTAAVSMSCSEYLIYQFEVLVGNNYSWVAGFKNGEVPSNAVIGGCTSSGENLYIGRAPHDNSLTPGKIHPSHYCLYIPFGGREYKLIHYDVLVKNK